MFSGAEVTDVLNRTWWKSAIWDILPARNTVEIDVRFQWWLYIDSLVALAIEQDKIQKRHGTMLHHVRVWKSYAIIIGIITSWDVWSSSILSMPSRTHNLVTANFFPPLRWWRTAFKASCTAWSLEAMRQSCVLLGYLYVSPRKQVSFMVGLIQLLPHPSSTHAWDLSHVSWVESKGTKTTVLSIGRSNMGVHTLSYALWVIENVVLWRATNMWPSITILHCYNR